MKINPSNLLTADQVARLVGVHRSAVYKAIKEGRLSTIRIAGHYYLSRDEVDRWIKDRKK
jgi:excisionase family DNA binding protein